MGSTKAADSGGLLMRGRVHGRIRMRPGVHLAADIDEGDWARFDIPTHANVLR